jgi:hypothetical protein
VDGSVETSRIPIQRFFKTKLKAGVKTNIVASVRRKKCSSQSWGSPEPSLGSEWNYPLVTTPNGRLRPSCTPLSSGEVVLVVLLCICVWDRRASEATRLLFVPGIPRDSAR